MNLHNYLQERNVKFDVIPHRETHDAQRMAEAVHVCGREVAKTVLLRANGGYTYILAVLPADKHIDFAKASKILGGTKLALAARSDVVAHCPECEPGALPPFGTQYNMQTIVDQSLVEDEEIVFEGCSHCESIRMKFDDYRRIEQPLIADIAC
jgi:Ala-tRNA(Pro) deacylase